MKRYWTKWTYLFKKLKIQVYLHVVLFLWTELPTSPNVLLQAGVLDTTLCDKVCQWYKSDRHDITEISLKVALNTITLTPNIYCYHNKLMDPYVVSMTTQYLYLGQIIYIRKKRIGGTKYVLMLNKKWGGSKWTWENVQYYT